MGWSMHARLSKVIAGLSTEDLFTMADYMLHKWLK